MSLDAVISSLFARAATPEGVPDSARYVPPGERDSLGDDAETVETEGGAVYEVTDGRDESTNADGPIPEDGVMQREQGHFVSAPPDPEEDIEDFRESQLVDEFIETVNSQPQGGFSVHRNLDTYNAEEDDAWIVGVDSVELSVDEGLDKDDVVDFYEDYIEVLEATPAVRLGGYQFEDGETISIDLSVALADGQEAQQVGEQLRQESVFNPSVALGEDDWENGSVETYEGEDVGDSPVDGPEEALQVIESLDSLAKSLLRGTYTMKKSNVEESYESEAEHDRTDIYVSDDGDEITRGQIVYGGWHEGGVEQVEEGYVVNGTLYREQDADDSDDESDSEPEGESESDAEAESETTDENGEETSGDGGDEPESDENGAESRVEESRDKSVTVDSLNRLLSPGDTVTLLLEDGTKVEGTFDSIVTEGGGILSSGEQAVRIFDRYRQRGRRERTIPLREIADVSQDKLRSEELFARAGDIVVFEGDRYEVRKMKDDTNELVLESDANDPSLVVSTDDVDRVERRTRESINRRDVLQQVGTFGKDEDPCWENYEMVGTKVVDGEEVPNCVPKSEVDGDVSGEVRQKDQRWRTELSDVSHVVNRLSRKGVISDYHTRILNREIDRVDELMEFGEASAAHEIVNNLDITLENARREADPATLQGLSEPLFERALTAIEALEDAMRTATMPQGDEQDYVTRSESVAQDIIRETGRTRVGKMVRSRGVDETTAFLMNVADGAVTDDVDTDALKQALRTRLSGVND